MKANNFMVGDWVLNDEGTPYRVAQVNDCCYDGNSSDLMLENGDTYTDIEPIPLTKEILEKNGFEVHRQFATFTEYWLDIPRKFVRVAPNSYIEIYNGENKNVHIDGKSYVHELQHALRLCGIDKEIVL